MGFSTCISGAFVGSSIMLAFILSSKVAFQVLLIVGSTVIGLLVSTMGDVMIAVGSGDASLC